MSFFESLEDRLQFAVSASFSAGPGVLTVIGDGLNNNIVISRNAAGNIFVNGGAVAIAGGSPTVANTTGITIFGLGGNDTITFDEANGALPRGTLLGGKGHDTITGGAGADLIFGQAGNDVVFGKGGADVMRGGAANDVLAGGDADDQAFGDTGNDRMIWNPGDDTDLNEGGAGNDAAEVNGGNVAEQFTATANGTRVRFDRVNPLPFAIDIGTTEKLIVNANGGDDTFAATGSLSGLILMTVDGGAGNDSILGGNGADTLNGGDGNDFIDGNQGSDVSSMGAGDDTFQWDPGDGSDVIEGQAGLDTMLFNGNDGAEIFAASANGNRLRFTRNLGNIVMDTNDVERVDLNALGGADTITVNDLSATDVTEINVDLAAVLGGNTGDALADAVIVNGTSDDDVMLAEGNANSMSVRGLAARVNVFAAEPANDRLTINGLAGDDVVEASNLAAGAIGLIANGGDGDDLLIGGAGNDTLLGAAGDDSLIGNAGTDVLNGAPGDDTVIQ